MAAPEHVAPAEALKCAARGPRSPSQHDAVWLVGVRRAEAAFNRPAGTRSSIRPHLSRSKTKLKNKQFLSPADMPPLRRVPASSRRRPGRRRVFCGPRYHARPSIFAASTVSTARPAAAFPRQAIPRGFAARMGAPAPAFAASVAGVDRSPSSRTGGGRSRNGAPFSDTLEN
jgi:hypothetical protein